MIHASVSTAYGSRQPAARSTETSADVRYLESRIDRLEMICEAMWNLLKERLPAADEDLMGCIAELDISDGVADGKVQRGAMKCPKCNRPNSRRHDFCIYCGEMVRQSPF